jgi:ubiquinone/menaquinone biosynthesis C-methylase UbiE
MAKAATQHFTAAWSYQQAIERFSMSRVASKYPSEYRSDHCRDRRERQAIIKALGSVLSESHILDLPCGTGRVTRLLVDQGFRVTAADVSNAMLTRARLNLRTFRPRGAGACPHVDFDLCDIMQTGYADGQFDAVVCNRLFHHFSEPSTRLRALKELRRICRGPAIISFFNRFALDAAYNRIRDILRGRTPQDRIPINYTTFHAELRSAGFAIQEKIPVRWGISPHWYVIAV